MLRWGRCIRCFAFVLLALTLIVAPLLAAPAHVPGEVIVKFRPGTSATAIAAIREDLGGTLKSELALTGAVCLKLDGLSVEDAVAKYKGDPAIEYLEPNYLWYADATPDDPRFDDLWGLHNLGQTSGTPDADIDAPEAWDDETGSSAVIVAVIDTGVDFSHPDLAANRWINVGEIAGNGVDDDLNGFIDDVNGYDFVNNDGNPMDDHSHGTHCAGTIGAVGNNGIGVAGVCWQVRIMAIKFLSASGGGTTEGAVSSVGYAVQMGADILSNSWGGGPYSEALLDAIAAAEAAGILFVAAAGNDGMNNDASPHYPSSYDLDNVVSVAATDHNDMLADFSCWGPQSVDLGAPGVDILSTMPGAFYDYKSGTSMACPHVSGALALIKARFPGITGSSARTLLLNTVNAVPDLAGKVRTAGRLNLAATMAGPDSIPPDPITDLAAAAVSGQWVDLTWTDTGDDGPTGTASSYELRFATFPIDSLNFGSATLATGLAAPQAAGTEASHRVRGLDFETGYWFAIRARDEYGLPSPVVSAAAATTAPPPVITAPTDTLAATLFPGGTDTRTLTIGNTGQSELTWSAAVVASGARKQYRLPPLPPSPSPAPEAGAPASLPPVARVQAELTAELRDLTGVRILWDQAHGQYAPQDFHNSMVAELESRGAELVVNLAPLTPALLATCDVFWTLECGTLTPAELSTLTAWLHGGGGLLLEGDDPTTSFNQILTAAGAGITYGGYASSGTTTTIYPHETTVDVGSLYLSNPMTGLSAVTSPAELLALDAAGQSALAWSQVQGGRVVAFCDELLEDYTLDVADNRLFGNQVFDWLAGPGWLRVEPADGVVAVGASQDVTVTFDATELCGGAVAALIALTSNDPLNPELAIPATLDVIGESDITVSPASFAFGTRFVGAVVTDTLTIANDGCELLTVGSVISDQTELTAIPAGPFTLTPGSRQFVLVTYAPTTVGPVTGQLTITSDDPDESVIMVPLSGTGVEPPVITVAPDTLASTLYPGGTDTRTLTIGNTGQSDLTWSAAVVASGARKQYRLPPLPSSPSPAPEAGAPALLPPVKRVQTELTAELRDLTGVRILWDQAHGQSSPQNYHGLMVTELESRGAELAVNLTSLTPALLATCDVFWTLECNTFTPAELSTLTAWLHGGGGLLLEGDDPTTSFNQILTAAGAGITYGGYASSGTTTTIYPHETTVDVGSLYLSNPMTGLSAVTSPAELLALDAAGRSALAWSQVQGGRIVAFCDELLEDYALGVADNRLFGNQVFDWLAGPGWLLVEPADGVVAAGASQDVTVTFDATELCGGAVAALIALTSNDPLNPELAIPATLDVIGESDITVSPASFAFGTRFVGAVVTDTLTIANDGCELLTVGSVISDQAELTAIPAGPFTVAPDSTRIVLVTYAPTTVGPVTGQLTITSDDPDEPVIMVPLSGTGVEPPVITVAPDSLAVSLAPGGTATRTLTIGNTGQSDLTWSAAITAADALIAQARGARFVIQDFPRSSPAASVAGPNGAAQAPPPFDKRVYSREMQNGTGPRILLLATYEPQSDAYGTALQNLGLGYTLVAEWTALDTELANAAWDLVIINNYNRSASFTGLDLLAAHLEQGGSLIFAGWDVQNYPSHDLISRLGVSYQSYMTFPLDFAAIDPFHRCFQSPNEISSLHATMDQLAIDGQIVTVRAGAEQLAAFQGYPLSGAIVLNDSRHGIFNAFQSANFTGDNDGDGRADTVELLENEIALVGLGASWLLVEPADGVVAAGASQDVTVTFDATELCGGAVAALIAVTSNDPLNPELATPATLDVLGESDITVSPPSLAFGTRFVGAVVTDTLTIANDGCELLTVGSVMSDHVQFTAVPADPFTLAPDSTRIVLVTYAPTTAGPVTGQLTLTSDDPDESVIMVPLSGTGVEPPVITVAPDTLAVSLAPGGTDTRTLTIGNTGQSELTWSAAVVASGARKQYRLPPLPSSPSPAPEAGAPALLVPVERTLTELTAELRDLTGVRILWDQAHGQSSPQNYHGLMVTELESRGAELAVNLTSLTPALLATCDVFWTLECSTFTPAELSTLTAWLHGGGGLLLEGDQSITPFNQMLTAAGAGITYGGSASSGTTATIYPHATTVGVDGLYLSGPITGLSAVTSPAGLLALDAAGRSALAWSQVQGGRIVAFCDELLEDYALGVADNRLFGNQVFDWLAGPGWLLVEPADGVVAAGASQDVTVTFDATELCGGAVAALIAVTSNDPLNPEVAIPTTLDVLGESDITISPPSLAFGTRFVGAVVTDTLTIANDGCELLAVGSVTSDQAEFTAVPAGPFTVPRDSTRIVLVTYAPTTVGPVTGQLTIASDDPDEPAVTVALAGTGVEPPVITVAPDSLAVSLAPGGTATRTLTIGNTGQSDLTWTAAVIDTSGWQVLEQSPVFRGATLDPSRVKRSVEFDDNPTPSGPGDMYRTNGLEIPPAPVVSTPTARTGLAEILAHLDAGFGAVTGLIPNRYDFSDGVTGSYISDGGNDMYDGGNSLLTELGGPLLYRDGLITDATVFGADGRYFTRKYPGLFALVADLDGVTSFRITGNLGADGFGFADGAVLATAVGGRQYLGFVKRVYNAGVPSVNHLVIVESDGNAAHSFNTYTNDDWHELTGLDGQSRLYYLLYASANGGYIDNPATALIMEAFLSGIGLEPDWLRIEPQSGTIVSGATQDLTVTFDATDLCGGTTAALIAVTSNDPLNPELAIPATLDVLGEPDITVLPDGLAFGTQFVGAVVTDTLTVANNSCELLTVGSVTSDQVQFTAVPTGPFTLAPDAMQIVLVTYAPTTAGPIDGQLTIESDDPDESVIMVPLSGTGVEPPAITVAPDSLAMALAPGGAAVRTLTITNTGQGDLLWSAAINLESAMRLQTLPARSAYATDAVAADLPPPPLDPQTSPELIVSLRELSGVRIMWDASHTQGLPGNWSGMVSDLETRGAEIVINSQTVTADILNGIDVFWTIRSFLAWQASEVTALVDWLHAGGGLLLEGDSDLSVSAFNTILTAAGAGITFGMDNAATGTTSLIAQHPSTLGVAGIYLNSPFAQLVTVAEPAEILVRDHQGLTVMAWSQVGSGRIMAASDEIFGVWGFSLAQNRLFGNQVFDWLAGSNWLGLQPAAGVVPSGATRDVTVTFGATGLPEGDYAAAIVVESNDPVTPVLSVPTRLTVSASAGSPEVTIVATLGDDTAEMLTAGIAAGATDGYDADQDLPASEPGSNAIATWFPHGEWQVPGCDRFSTDLRAPYDDAAFYKSWRFQVAADQAGEVVLKFASDPGIPAGTGLRLLDRSTGQIHDLRANATYTYSASAPEIREFRLRMGDGLPAPDPSGRSFATAWSMVATSLSPPAGATMQDAILSQAPAGAWLFSWEPTNANYVLLPGASPHVTGRGMWLYAPQDFDWTMTGTMDTAEIQVPLAHGWNLVGYPLWFRGDLTGTVIEHAGVRYAFTEAVALGLVAGMVFDFDARGFYRATTELVPWNSYWVASYTSGVTLHFHHEWMEDPGLLPPANIPIAKRVPTDWTTTVRIDGTGAGIVLGQSSQATDGFDAAWDLPSPPPSPSLAVAAMINLPRPEWSSPVAHSFQSDVRAAGDQPLVFPARVTIADPGIVCLHWECGDLPPDRDLEIRGGGRTIVASMRAVSSVELVVGDTPLDLEFATTNGLPEAAWLAEGLHLRNQPNPFNPSTDFQFNLEVAGDTRLLIYDARGTLVQEIQAGRLPAGPVRLTWNGVDRRGHAVASGVYLYRLIQEGRQLGGTRKMVLLK